MMASDSSVLLFESDHRLFRERAGRRPVDTWGAVDLRAVGGDGSPPARVRREAEMHLSLDEDDTCTEARVTLHLRTFDLTGFGRARRHPHDPLAPKVGEELAAARATADLAQQLLDLASYQIEKQAGRPVRLEL
jgi:hypothetical protein